VIERAHLLLSRYEEVAFSLYRLLRPVDNAIMLRSLGKGLGAGHGATYRSSLLRQPLAFKHYSVESGPATIQEVKRQTASFYISNVLPIQVGKFE
jgi:hypothetical protein